MSRYEQDVVVAWREPLLLRRVSLVEGKSKNTKKTCSLKMFLGHSLSQPFQSEPLLFFTIGSHFPPQCLTAMTQRKRQMPRVERTGEKGSRALNLGPVSSTMGYAFDKASLAKECRLSRPNNTMYLFLVVGATSLKSRNH